MTAHETEDDARRITVAMNMTNMARGCSGDTSPTNDRKQAAPVDEELEKKRAYRREASARSRKKTKNLIYELTDQNTLLQRENASLRAQLDASLAESARLKMIQEQEQQRAIKRSRTLNSMMQQLQERTQQDVRSHSILPSLDATASPSFASISPAKAPFPSRFVLQGDAQVPRSVSRAGREVPSLATASPAIMPFAPQLALHGDAQALRRISHAGREAPTLSLTSPARAPFPSQFALQGDALVPRRVSHAGGEAPSESHDFLANQQRLQRLREETRGVRDFLARHSI